MNKNKIALMVDSGTDVPMEYRTKYNIYWLPLLINYSDRQYLDGVDLEPSEMYDRLPTEIPKTSLPNHSMVSEMFDRIKADGYEKVLAVTISSGLSGTNNMIRVTAEEYEGLDIFVVDTRNISIGAGLIAIRAAQMINDENMPWDELTEKTLSIKPIISCNEDGIYYTAAKAIGRARSIQKVIDLAKEFAMQAEKSELAVMNGCAPEEGMKTRKKAEAVIPNSRVTVTGQIGVAMGIHTGPGLIGIGILQR